MAYWKMLLDQSRIKEEEKRQRLIREAEMEENSLEEATGENNMMDMFRLDSDNDSMFDN